MYPLPQFPTVPAFFALGLDVVRLALEAQAVIGMRLMAMATGQVPAMAEAQLMAPEKVAAFVEAQQIMALGVLTGRMHASPEKVVRLYRRRVRANRTRLARRHRALSSP
ncbi:hypothetical protein [Salinarimonas sp.]|uniref:hypothetical protein n=1 Tax=Salinarimonas sp. TaxID=2766526 RepID=UPI00391E0262